MIGRRAVLLAVVAAAACSPEPRRRFAVGFLAPVTPRVAAAARRMGLEIGQRAPAGSAVVSAAVAAKDGRGEVTADWLALRYLTDRAVVEGSSGIYLRLPSTPAGRDYMEYVEESQAVDRVLREILAMRPIFQGGEPSPAPFAVASGIALRAWAYQGRRFVLLVNVSQDPLPLEAASLVPWRALFSVRADAREDLLPCGSNRCLPAGGALWLEGRLLPNLRP